MNETQTHRKVAAPRQNKTKNFIFFAIRKKQSKLPNPIEKIIGKRVSFKTPTSHHDGAIIKTKIRIPRNSVIENNTVICGDQPSYTSVKN